MLDQDKTAQMSHRPKAPKVSKQETLTLRAEFLKTGGNKRKGELSDDDDEKGFNINFKDLFSIPKTRYLALFRRMMMRKALTLITSPCFRFISQVDFGFALLAGIFKRGLVPSVVTYTTLVRGLVSQDKFTEAENLFKKLLEYKQIEPDAIIFSTIVDGLCKTGNTSAATRLFRYMEKKVTYNSLMDGYCLRGEVDKALALLKTMRSKGILPNARTYTILINGYCKKLKVDRAIHLLEQMPSEGLTPTIETYNTILHGLFQTGRHVEARMFFKNKMLNQGLQLDIVTCRTLLFGLCQNGYIVEAFSAFHMMVCNGLCPDLGIYNILIHGLFKEGKVDDARIFFRNFPLKGLRPNVKSYTVMISEFCKEGLLEEANDIFMQMKASSCMPNDVTYNTLIRGCFENKKYDEGCVLIDEMVAHGFAADDFITSMVFDLLKSKEQDPALLALQKKFLP
ncbi:hypothetical protein AgCh_023654 [Apium graveolens]